MFYGLVNECPYQNFLIIHRQAAPEYEAHTHLQWFVQNFIDFALIMVSLRPFQGLETENQAILVGLQLILSINNTRDDEQITYDMEAVAHITLVILGRASERFTKNKKIRTHFNETANILLHK